MFDGRVLACAAAAAVVLTAVLAAPGASSVRPPRGGPGTAVGDLVPGDCVSGPSAGTEQWEAPIERVPCGAAYGGQVVDVSELPAGTACDRRYEDRAGRIVCIIT